MPPPLLSLRDATVTFGGRPLFEGVSVAVAKGDRLCLVGRNGSGKSTLLRALDGEIELDGGERFAQPGVRVAYLPQEPALKAGVTVAEYVARGLPATEDLETSRYRVEAVLGGLRLEGGRDVAALSGGEGRRAALARALVSEPEVLLLDEPTNHLDLPTIEWLEAELEVFPGAFVVVSHDRAFLTNVTRATLWLDRGRLLRLDEGFAAFERWSEEVLAQEEADAARLEKRIAAETDWLRYGVTARRRRNQGRLRALQRMRQERAARIRPQGSVKLAAEAGDRSGKLVIEAERIAKSFPNGDGGETIIVRNFSTEILRGDRVGLIGPNGAGKTTLLRLLIGELPPDAGAVRLGTNLRIAYFDQRRESLDPDATLWRTLCPGGGDTVFVRGRPRHVVSYLRDFLFDEKQAHQPVRALSGGERNRLLLARLLARPSNLLVLDEPTNDLDMDTLDLLEEALSDYEGTLLLVSHDRDFLDRLVTSVIAVEGGGRVQEYAGGYSDYHLRQRPEPPAAAGAKPAKPDRKKAAEPSRSRLRAKLSGRDERELDRLPDRIAALEREVAELEVALSDPSLYARDPDGFAAIAARLEEIRAKLAAAEERWLELELRREELG